VATLDIGDSIHVRDLVLPEGVTLRTDGDLSVVSVVAPKAIEEETTEGVEVAEGDEAKAAGEEAEDGAKKAGEKDDD
jgi:large subunit ribosomal protein L25